MGKGFGIAALIIMLISVPVPVLGTWIGYLALVIAGIAALIGNKSFVIATTVVGVIKMYFLSPSLMAVMYLPFADQAAPASAYLFFILTTFFAALPVVCLLCRPVLRGVLRSVGVQLPEPQGSDT